MSRPVVKTVGVCYVVEVNGHAVGKVQRQSRTRWCANSRSGADCYGGYLSLHETKTDAVQAVVNAAKLRLSDEMREAIGL